MEHALASADLDAHRGSAAAIRAAIARGALAPEPFRAALSSVPHALRDAWLDLVLGTGVLPPDRDDLPSGCAPLLPCSIDAALRALDHARVSADDVVVDVGSGLGRAALLARLATGASVIGVEVQRHLVQASRALVAELGVTRVSFVHGDATRLAAELPFGTVFFLYCPFSGARLERLVDGLEPIARLAPIRICAVDLPLPERPWLARVPTPWPDLGVVRSTFFDRP